MTARESSRKIVLADYTTTNHALKSGRVPITAVGNMRFSWLCIGHTRLTHRHLIARNDQQSKYPNAACVNETLPQVLPQMDGQ